MVFSGAALEPITAGSHATVVKHDQWHHAVAAYLACVTFVDAQIGELLKALDEGPHAANTVIVLWSDHGWHLGDGWHLGEKSHLGKLTGWERSTRVPLIIAPAKRHNGGFARDALCGKAVSLIDLFPTLIDLCRLDPLPELDSASLVPQLRDPHRASGRAVMTMLDTGHYSVRDARWRWIRYADGSEELYDHRNDPHEWYNLASLEQYRKVRDRMGPSCVNIDNLLSMFGFAVRPRY